ncbi:MAG: VOC family protein [Actinomycetota bacterium]
MIGSFEAIIFDCPDPRALARFYAEVLGAEIVQYDPERAELLPRGNPRPLIAFQRVTDYRPPRWPGQDVGQQLHIDVKIDDFEVAEAAVLSLGAIKASSDSPTFRVYLDPAGHPFCLIKPED